MSNFDLKKGIRRDKFLRDWEKKEDGTDQFALKNLERHRNYKGLKYYIVILSENGLDNLFLPYHVHPANDEKVAIGGEPFWNVTSKYLEHFKIQDEKLDDCLQRVCRIKELIVNQFNECGNLLEARFEMGFVSNDRDLAVPGHYEDHGEDKLYAGNIHRFVAYGLWVKENGHQPIKIYYCERT